jgi:hypothetical protein
MESDNCPICSRPPTDGVSVQRASGNRLRVRCPQCGRFELVGEDAIEASFDWAPELRWGLSCAARQASEARQQVAITARNAAQIARPALQDTRVGQS